jgi:hypothetical protein
MKIIFTKFCPSLLLIIILVSTLTVCEDSSSIEIIYLLISFTKALRRNNLTYIRFHDTL